MGANSSETTLKRYLKCRELTKRSRGLQLQQTLVQGQS